MSNSNYKDVLVLDLSNQSLKKISNDIIRYTNLKELNISDNQVTELPEFLLELKYLEKLTISNNQVYTIPDFFRNFKHLKELNISYNPLTSLPFNLWKLDKLTHLNISGLQLENLPVEIGNLRSLEVLKINALKLKSLPESIGYLKALKELEIEGNKLKKLPITFSNLKELEKVSLKLNGFKVFPEVVLNFKYLEYLDISNNSIQFISKNINVLKALLYLNISGNNIKTLPNSFYKLNFKNTNFHFKKNPLLKTTRSRIGKMFAREEYSRTKLKKKLKTKQKQKQKVKHLKSAANQHLSNQFVNVYLPIMLLLMAPIIFVVYNAHISQKKWEKEKTNRINIEQKRTQERKYFLLTKQKKENKFNEIIEKTNEVFIYTNDTADLELIIDENYTFENEEFYKEYSDSKKTALVNKFLNTKSYGYNISLNNGRGIVKNIMSIYDSIIPNDFVKKFRVLSYYRLTADEKELIDGVRKKRKSSPFILYVDKETKDTVFRVERGVIDFNELEKGNVDNMRLMFMPYNINLHRKDYYFYFSSLNSNVSRDEFLEAIENFNAMFIKKGKPEKHCTIKKVRVKKANSK